MSITVTVPDIPVDTTTPPVGVVEHVINGISIYPNPVSDIVTIALSEGGSDLEVTITDVIGKVVFNYKGDFKNKIDVDMSTYNNGVYFIQIKSGGEIFIRKIVKN